MNSEKLLKQTSQAFAVTLCVICMVAGCGKSEPPADSSSPGQISDDKQYVEQLQQQEKTKRGIMVRYSAARSELEKLKKENPDSPRIAELKKLMDDLEDEHQANRRRTEQMVRERMNRKANLKK